MVGVNLALSGAVSRSTTTDALGAFAFEGLQAGDYTLTPALAGADVTAVDFASTTAILTTFAVGGRPSQIVAGLDGNLWFTDRTGNRVVKTTPAGVTTGYPVPTLDSGVEGIAFLEGGVAFTESAYGEVGKIRSSLHPSGAGGSTVYSLSVRYSSSDAIVAGPNQSMWFTEVTGNRIGAVTMAGVITEYTIPTGASVPGGIAVDTDGMVWFTESAKGKLGRLDPTNGGITEVPVGGGPVSITAGPDGNIWFTQPDAGQVVRYTR